MQLVLACVFTLVFLGVLLMAKTADAAFLDLSRYDNSPPGGVPCMEVLAKKRLSFVPLKESRLAGNVNGLLVNLFVMVNEGEKTAALKKLSLFVS